MSSTVILTIQYFILVSFNLIDTENSTIIQLGSKAIVGIIFLYSLPAILKKNYIKLILTYSIAIFIFLLQYIIFPENQQYLNELIFPIFCMSLPVFIYCSSLQDWSILKQIMKKASMIVCVFGALLGVQIFIGAASVGDYSMAFSYYMLLPSIIFIDELLEKFSLKALIIAMISIAIILAIGARGTILCILVFVLLKLMKSNSTFKLSKTRIFFYMVFFGITIVSLINFQRLLLSIYNFFLMLGINSRSLLSFLSNDLKLSGRDRIYEKMITEISNHPFLGIGIAGDRRVLEGTYAHNILLEVLVNFGVVVGSILFITLLICMIRLLFMRDLQIYNMMIIWISLGFVSLFVSGSYLTDVQFWILLGLMMNKFSATRKRKVNLDDGVATI